MGSTQMKVQDFCVREDMEVHAFRKDMVSIQK
jgi:hypothetical protein